MDYSREDGKVFLNYVRQVVFSKFHRIPEKISVDKFSEKRGVFVTITKEGDLRGCIGFPYPVYPLNLALKKAANSAAFSDPRFRPISENELEKISFEVSVLTLPEEIKITDRKNIISQIEIGRDGLIVDLHGFSGLLLPQVATENNLDKKDFLEMTCMKAGLSKNAWLDNDCKVFKFKAQIFK